MIFSRKLTEFAAKDVHKFRLRQTTNLYLNKRKVIIPTATLFLFESFLRKSKRECVVGQLLQTRGNINAHAHIIVTICYCGDLALRDPAPKHQRRLGKASEILVQEHINIVRTNYVERLYDNPSRLQAYVPDVPNKKKPISKKGGLSSRDSGSRGNQLHAPSYLRARSFGEWH